MASLQLLQAPAAARSLCTWQALRSLDLDQVHQQVVEAVSKLCKLRALRLEGTASPLSVASLSALTALQSLTLSIMTLSAPGLSPVAHACSGLKQLKLEGVKYQPAAPQAVPQTALCTWPALVSLQLYWVGVGVVSHVLPTLTAAPQLAALQDDETQLWSAFILSGAAEEQLIDIQRLAADVHCMASYPVLCKALMLQLPTSPLSHWSELAAAVAPLGPTLTHLSLGNYSAAKAPAAMLLCQALLNHRRTCMMCQSCCCVASPFAPSLLKPAPTGCGQKTCLRHALLLPMHRGQVASWLCTCLRYQLMCCRLPGGSGPSCPL